MIAAVLNERGHAGLLALDCSPAEGGVRAGRLIVADDLPAGEYAGQQIDDPQHKTPVRVRVPALESGVHTDFLLEVLP